MESAFKAWQSLFPLHFLMMLNAHLDGFVGDNDATKLSCPCVNISFEMLLISLLINALAIHVPKNNIIHLAERLSSHMGIHKMYKCGVVRCDKVQTNIFCGRCVLWLVCWTPD